MSEYGDRAGLPEMVSEHMQTHFPDTEEAGGWTCARDYRDNTAVVVYRRGEDRLSMSGVRGTMLWRWLCSLRDAGFTATPRLDMGAFGRPGEDSPDGIAHWLHITAHDPAHADSRTLPELADELERKLRDCPGWGRLAGSDAA